jgi:hypothetical protein
MEDGKGALVDGMIKIVIHSQTGTQESLEGVLVCHLGGLGKHLSMMDFLGKVLSLSLLDLVREHLPLDLNLMTHIS